MCQHHKTGVKPHTTQVSKPYVLNYSLMYPAIYYKRVYPKVSGLVAWSEKCKWCSSLPLDAVVSLFCESV